MRRLVITLVLVLAGTGTAAAYPLEPDPPPPLTPQVVWRVSSAVGSPTDGRLVKGVLLPAEGRDFFTWDPVLDRSPNRAWRRYGTDRLVRTLLRVLREFRSAHPEAPRLGIGDLSRPRGGPFGARYGGLGHFSHQNGLDADVYYPRLDGRELEPVRPAQIDRRARPGPARPLRPRGRRGRLRGPANRARRAVGDRARGRPPRQPHARADRAGRRARSPHRDSRHVRPRAPAHRPGPR